MFEGSVFFSFRFVFNKNRNKDLTKSFEKVHPDDAFSSVCYKIETDSHLSKFRVFLDAVNLQKHKNHFWQEISSKEKAETEPLYCFSLRREDFQTIFSEIHQMEDQKRIFLVLRHLGKKEKKDELENVENNFDTEPFFPWWVFKVFVNLGGPWRWSWDFTLDLWVKRSHGFDARSR